MQLEEGLERAIPMEFHSHEWNSIDAALRVRPRGRTLGGITATQSDITKTLT